VARRQWKEANSCPPSRKSLSPSIQVPRRAEREVGMGISRPWQVFCRFGFAAPSHRRPLAWGTQSDLVTVRVRLRVEYSTVASRVFRRGCRAFPPLCRMTDLSERFLLPHALRIRGTLGERSKRPSTCTVLLASAGEAATLQYKPLGVVDVKKLGERL
jgi:hypothetical protein